MSHSQERIAYTAEDAAIFAKQSVVVGARQLAADDFDYSLMLRLEQWRGSSLQAAFPIAKQLACWDFYGRRV